MKLLTQIPLSKTANTIDYNSQLVLLGSCFSKNIGEKLNHFKFQNTQNPFGIIFHPLAIEKLIQKAVQQDVYREEDIFHMNERWHCFDAHSCLSNTSKEKLLAALNEAVNSTGAQLKKASHVIITLGTAWLYRNTNSMQVVANCHKVPQSNFTKELLDVHKVTESLRRTIAMVRSVNSTAQFIFTVSPVRHLKDGFVENQLSKAHLITGIHKVLIQDKISYFPSYEIMMDELRDYRFYGKDMIHPNEIAIDYIWVKFVEVWMEDSIYDTMLKVDEIQRSLKHSAFNPDGEAHQKFLTSLRGKIAYIKKKYPFMDFNLKEA
ncbi:GSCFA domain-containing protein [Maribacter hydrothermalis]|uniref:GSCFA domain-containing protein n=1 Tax=Maribacter hydrothermalis TaxID=1836467 RepID=A0A1B7Z9L3_9FLAO|nr:GSCFA domain-containing protein [Maribacter hydrothermalis]APQ16707.1 GSCFA domain-containing protein [Maribacter hydrothermalis]OBR39376.1 GSCFA domain-containing protein [Maribacter hydrothermalis]